MTLANETMFPPCKYSTFIQASPARVWEALTNIQQMQSWMGEPEMNIEVSTDWREGHSIVVKGFHHVLFENKGRVLRFDPPKQLRYSHLSSVSRLADIPANHSIFDFLLEAIDDGTKLTITSSGFPTEAIYRHIDFYWRVTVGVLKTFVEKGA